MVHYIAIPHFFQNKWNMVEINSLLPSAYIIFIEHLDFILTCSSQVYKAYIKSLFFYSNIIHVFSVYLDLNMAEYQLLA